MPQSGNKLPNPELNPLLNPTLGQNLGRWAQVYFTNPPEKRDEAVLELLRELEENGSAEAANGDAFPVPDSFEAMRLEHLKAEAAAAPVTAELREPVMVCPSCQQGNPASQKFCGFCGATLATGSEPMRDAEIPVSTMAPEPRAIEPPTPESDIDWLRNSAVVGFDTDTKQGGWWKYGLTGVLILLAGFGYLEYVSRIPPKVVVTNPNGTAQTQANVPQNNVAPAPVAENTPAPDHPIETDIPPIANSGAANAETTSAAPPAAAAPEKQAPASEPAETKAAPPETNASFAEKEIPPEKNSPSKSLASDANSAAPSIDNGALELKQAQDFLEGRNVPHDSAAAARLLWRAVSKQNVAASVMLADMYKNGDGVPKSCDQARLLLVAASKKGSTQAADRLRSLESGGCR